MGETLGRAFDEVFGWALGELLGELLGGVLLGVLGDVLADVLGEVCVAGLAASDALVQTGVVMSQRYERRIRPRIGRRSRSGLRLRL
ncbi:hypothetical protein AB0G32_06530 [Streptomyces sp. NPDC023723]|uniref:hypothetical protein n=1 Tax=Streptomyces sp. NPDC023723 TaxID=3154323 RepID=UPI0033FB2C08